MTTESDEIKKHAKKLTIHSNTRVFSNNLQQMWKSVLFLFAQKVHLSNKNVAYLLVFLSFHLIELVQRWLLFIFQNLHIVFRLDRERHTLLPFMFQQRLIAYVTINRLLCVALGAVTSKGNSCFLHTLMSNAKLKGANDVDVFNSQW